MTNTYLEMRNKLLMHPRRWLVTGAAGFIGSHLIETLLNLGQEVVGLDNFITGSRENLAEATPPGTENNFHFIEADIRNPESCATACRGVDYVLHQAALGSVPRSLNDPATTNAINAGGFINVIRAAVNAEVRSFVYASSSSVYGDLQDLPKRENAIGTPLSPYAVSKLSNELYAGVFYKLYGLPIIGLRYFNVFGTRQDPRGPYAAVIPRWFNALIAGKPVTIFGDGESSRDFCPVQNVVQANILAALCQNDESHGRVYNIAVGKRTTLLQLSETMSQLVADQGISVQNKPLFKDFRPGDVRHSLADISLAVYYLGYQPTCSIVGELRNIINWYIGDNYK